MDALHRTLSTQRRAYRKVEAIVAEPGERLRSLRSAPRDRSVAGIRRPCPGKGSPPPLEWYAPAMHLEEGVPATGQRREAALLFQAFARLKPGAFGASVGLVAGAGLALVTLVLVARGPAEPGGEVGPHLGLLSHYMPGYAVTWAGAAIGLVWGFVYGFVLGAAVAVFLNAYHRVSLGLVERGFRREGLVE